MKRMLLSAGVLLLMCCCSVAQDRSLPAPKKDGGKSLMEALSVRESVREYSDKELSDQQLADLLWAAMGQNRPNGKLTAPTAVNKQEIRLFVFDKNGVAEYLPATHELKQVAEGDHRALVASRQEFVLQAPLSLVMVADMDKFGSTDERAKAMVAVDTGIVCQNINLFCAAQGLCTVPRATMDQEGIQKLLGLTENQIPLMNNPIGFPK